MDSKAGDAAEVLSPKSVVRATRLETHTAVDAENFEDFFCNGNLKFVFKAFGCLDEVYNIEANLLQATDSRL